MTVTKCYIEAPKGWIQDKSGLIITECIIMDIDVFLAALDDPTKYRKKIEDIYGKGNYGSSLL